MSESQNGAKRLLLISNSTLHGSGYLDHAEAEIRSFLGHVNRILFIPFALNDHDSYAAKARNRFSAMGYEFESIHEAQDPLEAVEAMEAIFIGGGNTFRLLKALYAFDLLELDGADMRREPIEVRKATLASILRKSRHGVRLNEHLEHPEGDVVFRHACKMGLEGIVSKRLGSRYRSGRSPDWLKSKNPQAPAVKREAEEDWGQ